MLKTRHHHKQVSAPLFWALLVFCCQANSQPTGQQQDIPLESSVDNDGQEIAEKQLALCMFESVATDKMDEFRTSTHRNLCRSALWIDGLFGDEHEFDDRGFSGKLSAGFRQDETEGFDPRLRVRFKTTLPNVSSRLNAFIGRVEEESYVSNTEVSRDHVNAVGLRSANDDDDEWLIGLGYRNPNNRNNGFDFSVGAKLSSGLKPYAKVTHRHLFPGSEKRYWRTTQTLFWREEDGLGISSSLDHTRILSDRDIFEWDTSIKYTEDSEQWEWITSTALHHSFNKRKGISSRSYIRGEEKNAASIPEFGVTFTYVQPFFKPWLLIETGMDFRWEKEQRDSEYKSAVRFGLQFQMLLGDYYSSVQQEHRDKR